MHPTGKRNKKPHNRWIGEALQSDKFSELCVAKPLESGSKGENFFCVPHLVRSRQEERLRIVTVANPTEGLRHFHWEYVKRGSNAHGTGIVTEKIVGRWLAAAVANDNNQCGGRWTPALQLKPQIE